MKTRKYALTREEVIEMIVADQLWIAAFREGRPLPAMWVAPPDAPR